MIFYIIHKILRYKIISLIHKFLLLLSFYIIMFGKHSIFFIDSIFVV